MAIESLRAEARVLNLRLDFLPIEHDKSIPKDLAFERTLLVTDVILPSSLSSQGRNVSFAEAILRPTSVLNPFLAPAPVAKVSSPKVVNTEERGFRGPRRKLVAVTACPTGIAHTFMAAEALKNQAQKMDIEIHVETQGNVGAKSLLTFAQIKEADAVIIAADTAVDLARFAGKILYRTNTGTALEKAAMVIEAALYSGLAHSSAALSSPSAQHSASPSTRAVPSGKHSGPYQHLLTGVSYMLPLVVAGGLAIALSFVFGIEAFKVSGSLASALMQIGGGAAFKLIVPVLAGYIAFSIADRPGLAPGLIGGWLAAEAGAGFLGGIIAGLLAGYSALLIRDRITLPQTLAGLMPILIIPLFASLITGLLMIYVVATPMKGVMDALTAGLLGLSGANAILLGALLGAMMGFDLGGPTNKAAYAFTVGLLSSNTFGPMAAAMAGGMTPALGVSFACFVARQKFSTEERQAGKTAGILGLCFISEGAIPFAARDPFRVIPANVMGSALAGALSMYFGCTIRVPHGGVFVFGIPNAVENLPMYLVSIAAGTLLTGLIIAIVFKKSVPILEDVLQ
ncbi:MAG: PTS transporter subunit EIIC [Chitinophagaceae bacterium]|nr:PTS transporter subunit EIIC [Oligoflexus sp.]